MGDRVTIGTLEELRRAGCLTGKAQSQPICVFWSDGAPFAVDDRCPHMGFPLHRGTVESGLLTCHWHHARFDLSSGGTLDPWADDVRAYPVEIDGDRVTVIVEAESDRTGHLFHRLQEGLEQGITLVMAKAVLGMLERRRAAERHRAGGGRLRHPLPGCGMGRRAHRADGDGQRAATSRSGRPCAGAGARTGLRFEGHPWPSAPVRVAPARRRRPGRTTR